jgi:uncharacterized OsmC-like protein
MKTVSVTAKMGPGTLVQSDIRGHQVKIDQPSEAGGGNEGPTPLEYLMFSLGGCIASIARIIAMQRKIDLRGVEVEVGGQLDVEVLLGKHQDARTGFQAFEVRVKLDADLSTEEKEKLVHEIDKRCPVSDNLLKDTPVEVTLAD